MSIVKHYASTMSSVSALQGTCNRQEIRSGAKLTKLDIGTNPNGVPATEATFEEFDGDIGELGKAVVTEGGTGENMAFILTNETNVEISRR